MGSKRGFEFCRSLTGHCPSIRCPSFDFFVHPTFSPSHTSFAAVPYSILPAFPEASLARCALHAAALGSNDNHHTHPPSFYGSTVACLNSVVSVSLRSGSSSSSKCSQTASNCTTINSFPRGFLRRLSRQCGQCQLLRRSLRCSMRRAWHRPPALPC